MPEFTKWEKSLSLQIEVYKWKKKLFPLLWILFFAPSALMGSLIGGKYLKGRVEKGGIGNMGGIERAGLRR